MCVSAQALWCPHLFSCIPALALRRPHAPAPYLELLQSLTSIEHYCPSGVLSAGHQPTVASLFSTSPTARILLYNGGQTRPPKGVEGSIGHGSGGDGQHCATRVRPEGDGKSTRHPQRCNRYRRREERRSRVTTSLGEACSLNTVAGVSEEMGLLLPGGSVSLARTPGTQTVVQAD